MPLCLRICGVATREEFAPRRRARAENGGREPRTVTPCGTVPRHGRCGRAGEVAEVAVRVLIGTRKGAFIATSDDTRRSWSVTGPLFAGWEVYHVQASPVDPDRLYAAPSRGWFGQTIQRSDDGGRSWQLVGNDFRYDGEIGDHFWYDGTLRPWHFTRVWHLAPSPVDANTVYAGTEDAALFVSSDGGQTWPELTGLRCHDTAPNWAPGAGGLCLHTILFDPRDATRMHVAISAAGVLRSDDAGLTWRTANRGLRSDFLPQPEADVGHCVHKIARHPARPDVLFMQKHWDVMRSDDGGNSWYEISGDLPSDFGFPIAVHPHDPDTVYVVPITSDTEHFPPEGRLRIYRSRTGGRYWEPLSKGLPQEHCYVNVLRDAFATDELEPCGLYVGTTGGQIYASADEGATWTTIVRDLPAVLSVEVQTLR